MPKAQDHKGKPHKGEPLVPEDDVGDTDRNLRLSEARAMAVRDALIARGVDPGRLLVEAYGESQPIADNATTYGRELNRRIEFELR